MEKKKVKVENLPIIMSSLSEIQYNVDNQSGVSGGLPEGNLYKDFWETQRGHVMQGHDQGYEPEFNESLTIFYPSGIVIIYRRNDHKWITYERDENNTIQMNLLTTTVVDKPIKHDTKLVLTPDTFMLTFNKKYDGDPKDNCSVDERRKRQLAELAVKQSVINCVRKRSSKHIYMNGNDVLIEGRKIGGSESFSYDHQHHEHTIFQWYYDHEIFHAYMNNDHNHIQSLKNRGITLKGDEDMGGPSGAFAGITGISNEIPGYSKEEFAEDMLKEMQYFLFMMQ